MLKNTTLILFLAFGLSLHAQIDFGSIMIGAQNSFEVEYNIDFTEIYKTHLQFFNFNTSIGYFTRPKTLIGIGLDATIQKGIRKKPDHNAINTLSIIRIPIFLRQYVNGGRLRGFVALQSNLNWYKEKWKDEEIEKEQTFEMVHWLGGGLNYFLSENIALEAVFRYRPNGENEIDLFNDEYQFPRYHIDFGLKLFLNQKQKNNFSDGAELAKRYFQKGNSLIEGQFSYGFFNKDFFGNKDKNVPIYGSFGYFLNNRWKIELRSHYHLKLAQSGFKPKDLSYGGNISTAYIQGISEQFFIAPKISAHYNKVKNLFLDIPHISFEPVTFERLNTKEYGLGIGIDTYYFLSGKILLLAGINLSYQNLRGKEKNLWDISANELFINSLQSDFSVGVQYFVSTNIAFSLKTKYRFFESDIMHVGAEQRFSNDQDKFFRTDLGIHYFLFKKKKE